MTAAGRAPQRATGRQHRLGLCVWRAPAGLLSGRPCGWDGVGLRRRRGSGAPSCLNLRAWVCGGRGDLLSCVLALEPVSPGRGGASLHPGCQPFEVEAVVPISLKGV